LTKGLQIKGFLMNLAQIEFKEVFEELDCFKISSIYIVILGFQEKMAQQSHNLVGLSGVSI
jgi:hypothetical protein